MIRYLLFCCLTGVSLGIQVHQTPPTLIKNPGDNVQLVCTHEKTDYRVMLWYQQPPGETALKLIGYVYFKDVTMEEPYKQHFNITGDMGGDTAKNGSLLVRLKGAELSAVYHCAASTGRANEAYFGNGTKLTVLEYDVTQPRVNILQPSSNECQDKTDRKNKKTLVCVASDFYPDHVSVSWQIEGVAVTDGVATDNAALRDGRFYSITSRLRVMARMWHTPGKKFTCIVSFYNGSSTSDHSDTVFGIKGPGEGMTREKYVTITQTAKFSYGVFIAKSSLYGVFVLVLVWKLQGSSGKQ